MKSVTVGHISLYSMRAKVNDPRMNPYIARVHRAEGFNLGENDLENRETSTVQRSVELNEALSCNLPTHPPVCSHTCLHTRAPACLSAYMPTCLSAYLHACLPTFAPAATNPSSYFYLLGHQHLGFFISN